MLRISFLTAELLFSALWLLLRAAVWLRQGRIDRKREAALLLMYVNLAVILRFVFFPAALADGQVPPLVFRLSSLFPLRVNPIPIVRLFQYRYQRDLLLNVLGNIALFVPTGMLLPLLYRRFGRFAKTAAAGFLLSLCIELLQLPFSARATDVDDLILNTAGTALGWCVFAAIRSLRGRGGGRKKKGETA